MFFWNGVPKKLTPLKLEHCPETCPMEDFLKILTPVLPSDDDMRCLFKNLQPADIEKILNSDYSV